MDITINTLGATYHSALYPKAKIDLLDFAELVGAEIVITERENDEYRKKRKIARYCVHFKNCEAKEGAALVGYYGDGNNINRALSDYAKQISGKLLVFDAMSGCMRHQVYTPRITYKPSKKIKKMFKKYSDA